MTGMGDGPSRTGFVVALIAMAVAAGVGAGFLSRAPSPPEYAASPRSTIDRGMVDVHVAGWVVSPGVVTVRQGAIVAEAIEAAGGLKVGARPDSLNLASVVGQGDQILVPGPEADTTPGGERDGLLSINQATASELQALPGVGPVLAERIVAYRNDNGLFDRLEDLLEVPGIGETKLAAMRDLVRP